MIVGGYVPALGEAESTAGWRRVGGTQTKGERENRVRSCADQTRTVTEVGSANVSNVIPQITASDLLLFCQLFVMCCHLSSSFVVQILIFCL